MQFVYPGFLLALAAISIPILVHLFNFKKYKKLYFSDLRFLREVQEETKSKSRLKHLLILCSRILLIAFLVLAFAQPFIPASSDNLDQKPKTVSIFIDNSFSMNNVGEYGQLFNVAKQYAYQIVKNYPNGSKFRILSNEKSSWTPRVYSQETALTQIGEIKESSNSRSAISAVKGIQDLQENDEYQHEMYLITDFQSKNESFRPEMDSNTTLHLIPLSGNSQDNVSLDSLWFDDPVRKSQVPEKLWVKLTNHSKSEVSSFPVSLYINKEQKALINIDLPAESTESFAFQYTLNSTGIVQGKVVIDDFPITFDNSLYFAYNINEVNRILVLNQSDTSKAISAVYADDAGFKTQQSKVSSVSNKALQNNDLIILNETNTLSESLRESISKWVVNGGQLIVFPPRAGSLEQLNLFLNQIGASQYGKLDTNDKRVSHLEYEHPLYNAVFESQNEQATLPQLKESYPLIRGRLPRQALMSTVDGQAFLEEEIAGNGKVYLFSVSLDPEQSNLSKHSLFVVSMYQIGINNSNNGSLYGILGDSPYFSTKRKDFDNQALVQLSNNEIQIIPERRNKGRRTEFWFHEQLNTAGFYTLSQSGNDLEGFALNYSQEESVLKYISPEELERVAEDNKRIYVHNEGFDQIGKSIQSILFGKQLWQQMLMLSLLMILFEILLIKLWKE